mmetsp:Transcript_11167/g.37951  ORF Transcript_11167/g.37951 Transcript_11167/m.37951 type:complete len:83 (+) Transcript_11167:1868-2116(+)
MQHLFDFRFPMPCQATEVPEYSQRASNLIVKYIFAPLHPVSWSQSQSDLRPFCLLRLQSRFLSGAAGQPSWDSMKLTEAVVV